MNAEPLRVLIADVLHDNPVTEYGEALEVADITLARLRITPISTGDSALFAEPGWFVRLREPS